jgi:valyl-tRNA synthetase
VVRTIRNARAEYKVEMGKWVESSVYAGGLQSDLKAKSAVIESLARTRPLSILPRGQRPANAEKAMVYVLKDADVVIPLAGMVDTEAEKARLTKEMEVLEREILRLSGRLADSQFTSRAPAAVIEKEKGRLNEYQDKVARMKAELKQLN